MANPRAAAKKRRQQKRQSAARADKYTLYQKSVQDPETEIDFFNRVFKAHFKRQPHRLREDFCAAAALACRWVAFDAANEAWGLDIDPEPLAWGTANNADKLDDGQRERLHLLEQDVLAPWDGDIDVIYAGNFSYCCFKTRAALRAYFEAVRKAMPAECIFVCDLFGGPEAQRMGEEETKHDGFTYVWDQHYYDAITNETRCYIHFRFPDGSGMEKAFSYDWRMWTIAEVRELLAEAGFSASEVYWEGTDEDGEGDGHFEKTESAENEDAWIAYIVGLP